MTVVYLWRIRKRSLFIAMLHMALDRFFLSRIAGITFHKSIGTGTGERFTPSDADLTVWGLIAHSQNISLLDESLVIRLWRKIATLEQRIVMEPLSSHGAWAKRNPFPISQRTSADERIVAITRARIKWSKNRIFWDQFLQSHSHFTVSPGYFKQSVSARLPLAFKEHSLSGEILNPSALLPIRAKSMPE